jgi:hypothetical protein
MTDEITMLKASATLRPLEVVHAYPARIMNTAESTTKVRERLVIAEIVFPISSWFFMVITV